jgi:hypothetical protein
VNFGAAANEQLEDGQQLHVRVRTFVQRRRPAAVTIALATACGEEYGVKLEANDDD